MEPRLLSLAVVVQAVLTVETAEVQQVSMQIQPQQIHPAHWEKTVLTIPETVVVAVLEVVEPMAVKVVQVGQATWEVPVVIQDQILYL